MTMAEFMKPIVDRAIAILKARTPNLLGPERTPFADYGKTFTGAVQNYPSVWVQPVRTGFSEAAQHTRRQTHVLVVKIAVSASDPAELCEAALDYVSAADLAFTQSDAADWNGALAGGVVMRVFVRGHDYGPLSERGGALARYPELEVIVETEES
jgi:hypothetical protein